MALEFQGIIFECDGLSTGRGNLMLPWKKTNPNLEAFETDVMVHLDALYGMALHLTHDEQDAQDIVQDSLVKAFRFRSRFEPGSNIKAWLFRILTNTFYNQYRKEKNIRRMESEASEGDGYLNFMSEASVSMEDAETVLLEKISTKQIKEALERLPDEFRFPVVLCDLYDFSYREIAEALECPIGTVMSRLYRGRRLLQKWLGEYAVENGFVEIKDGPNQDKRVADLGDYRMNQFGERP
ncbi:MAG: sigma-70 family RNA polymerase sigma factor [Pseudomonadota bacterium]